jgi:hypothetical protein
MIFPNEGSEDTPHTLVQKGQNVALVIECGGIWFANGKFGVTWRLVQAVLQPKTGLRGKCHIAIDSATKARLEQEAEVSLDGGDDDVEVEVADSDEEEDDDDDEASETSSVKEQVKQEVAAEVAPKVVKKVVKKRGRKPKVAEA